MVKLAFWVRSLTLLVLFAGATLSPLSLRGAETDDALAVKLAPFLRAIAGDQSELRIDCRAEFPIDGKPQEVVLRLARFDDESFDLEIEHRDCAASLRRRPGATAFALPKHKVVFIGTGRVDDADCLSPRGVAERLITSRTSVSTYASMVFSSSADSSAASALLRTLAGVTYDADSGSGGINDCASFTFTDDGALRVAADDARLLLAIESDVPAMAAVDDWPGLHQTKIPRHELERTLIRGARRALEILAPSKVLTNPLTRGRSVPHGRLTWVDGQRVVLLQGSPTEIGRAHGQLLSSEAHACIDSVLHTFGTVQTIRTGRWFRHDLDSAYARLSPHIPDRHKTETRAMARALGLEEELVDSLNVFPELFHCSGFAVFGKATRDGKLYHGRVLDYMTTIGLQDSATTFIVKADGQIPFANIGYAGFIGSVSGMNAEAISLGEMGGGGEGKWDGVPMATLMRRALEECDTLDEVMELWRQSPRTCEYYYVFADGKTNRAVGVAAYPDSIEFIQPGQAHERLGAGIEDAVVLSAGERLTTLRQRVQQKHGKIDSEVGRWLMSRPVAMESNLHNVLFIPEDGVLYVANADHQHPAAERPYARLDLSQLLESIDANDSSGKLTSSSESASATTPITVKPGR